MRLIFPNGEHEPFTLEEGVSQVGSGSDCALVLVVPGVAVHHCEFEVHAGQVAVRPLDATAPTVLNGRQITQETALKPGDLLLFGRVGCRVSAVDAPAVAAAPAPARKSPSEAAQTRVRMTLPKFMLRGVSGPTFGKTFALTGTMVIGRQHDCDIPVPAEEVSRHHARLQVTGDGVMVEDMGSANGTFIADKRVQGGMLKPGEELRLDTVRFQLVAPGMDAKQQAGPARAEAQKAETSDGGGSSKGVWIVIGVIVVALVAFGVLRYLGIV